MREQKGAATAIQARYRQRAAQREVNALRKEKQELPELPTFQEQRKEDLNPLRNWEKDMIPPEFGLC